MLEMAIVQCCREVALELDLYQVMRAVRGPRQQQNGPTFLVTGARCFEVNQSSVGLFLWRSLNEWRWWQKCCCSGRWLWPMWLWRMWLIDMGFRCPKQKRLPMGASDAGMVEREAGTGAAETFSMTLPQQLIAPTGEEIRLGTYR